MSEMTAASMFPLGGHSVDGGVLVASASGSLRAQVRQRFGGRCWPVQEALGGADALAKLESGHWQLLFLDQRLPDLDAEELIQIIKLRFPGIEVILLDSDAAAGPARWWGPTMCGQACMWSMT